MGGWILGMALMAGAAALALWRLLNPPPVLVVDQRGILDRRLRAGWIAWDEIEGAYRTRGEHVDGLCLRVRVSDRLWRRLRRRSSTSRRPELIDIPLDLEGTQLSEVEILQAMLTHDTQPPPAADFPNRIGPASCR